MTVSRGDALVWTPDPTYLYAQLRCLRPMLGMCYPDSVELLNQARRPRGRLH